MPPNNENYHALAPPQAEAATAELYWVRRVFNGDTPTNAPPLRSVLKGKNVTLDEFRHWAAVVRAFFWWMVEEHLRPRAWAFGWVQDRVHDNPNARARPTPPYNLQQVASYAFLLPDDDGVYKRVLLPLLDLLNHANPDKANANVGREDGYFVGRATKPIKQGEQARGVRDGRGAESGRAAHCCVCGVEVIVCACWTACAPFGSKLRRFVPGYAANACPAPYPTSHLTSPHIIQVVFTYSPGNEHNDHSLMHYGFVDRTRLADPQMCCQDMPGGDLWNCPPTGGLQKMLDGAPARCGVCLRRNLGPGGRTVPCARRLRCRANATRLHRTSTHAPHTWFAGGEAEVERLQAILASFPTTEKEDEVLLSGAQGWEGQAGRVRRCGDVTLCSLLRTRPPICRAIGMDREAKWREATLVEFRMLRKRALRQMIDKLRGVPLAPPPPAPAGDHTEL